MEKQVKVKAYTRKSRSGKRVVVKAHTSHRKAGTGGKTKMKKEYVERLARKSAYPGMARDIYETTDMTGISHKEALRDAHEWYKNRSKDEMTAREYDAWYQKQYGKKGAKKAPKKRGCCK